MCNFYWKLILTEYEWWAHPGWSFGASWTRPPFWYNEYMNYVIGKFNYSANCLLNYCTEYFFFNLISARLDWRIFLYFIARCGCYCNCSGNIFFIRFKYLKTIAFYLIPVFPNSIAMQTVWSISVSYSIIVECSDIAFSLLWRKMPWHITTGFKPVFMKIRQFCICCAHINKNRLTLTHQQTL